MKRRLALAVTILAALYSLIVYGAGTPIQNADATATAAIQQANLAATPRMGTAIAQTTALAPTATMSMPMEGATDGGNTCGNLSEDPNAHDQNGVPLNVWAPGLRVGCGFAGFENGDDPMPAGTHLPQPRPFDFDRAVVANESAFGFKVYYRKGSEGPAGFQGTGGCGDVRVILHQGGSVHGFTTQYHTYQFATDVCDSAGNHHIIDVGGRIDTGCFQPRKDDPQRCGPPDRVTADTLSCDGKTKFLCATVWYGRFQYQIQGGNYNAFSNMGFLVENPITLYDPNCPTCIHLANGDGTTTMLRDNQFAVPASNHPATWWAKFNATTGINEIVPAGTAGAWQMYVDPWFGASGEFKQLEPAYGVDHPHPVAGVKYPN